MLRVPFRHDGGSLDAALVAAEYGLPTGFMTMIANLTTGPATLAGNLAVATLKSLPGWRLSNWLIRARRFSTPPHRPHPICGREPILAAGRKIFFMGRNECAFRFLQCPLSMGSFATGAKEPNWQAGIENSLSTFMACVVMSDMLLGRAFCTVAYLVVCRDDDGLRNFFDHTQDHARDCG